GIVFLGSKVRESPLAPLQVNPRQLQHGVLPSMTFPDRRPQHQSFVQLLKTVASLPYLLGLTGEAGTELAIPSLKVSRLIYAQSFPVDLDRRWPLISALAILNILSLE
ncbi:hypothetical protein J6590_073922, partial [Homalodisca vitripennis]